MIGKVAGKSANLVSKLSALSPEQLEQIEVQRDVYLSEMPDMNGLETEKKTSRLLAAGGVEIYNAYLPQIQELYLPIEKQAEYAGDFSTDHNIRYINITKWVTDKKENSLEKLVNVYEVLSNDTCNISLVFHRKRTNTDVYLAITNIDNADSNRDVNDYYSRLKSAIRGNFPGSTWKEEAGMGVLPCFDHRANYSVASASNIPTEKSEKFISQTIEKLLDGMVPENRQQEYLLILLATPIQDIQDRKLRLSELYSALSPYASWQTNYTYTTSDSKSSSATVGINIGASAGSQTGESSSITDTQGQTDTEGETNTDTESETEGESTSKGTTETEGETRAEGRNSSWGVNGGVGIGIPTGPNINIGGNYSQGKSSSTASSFTEAISSTTGFNKAKSLGKSLAKSTGKSLSKSLATTAGVSKALNFGMNFGANFARTSSVTATIGKNEGITQSFTNHNIKHALELLDQQMERLEKSTALGMWDFAAYVMSEDQAMANNVAHSYLALTQGEESHMSQTSVNLWRGDLGEESGEAREIAGYLRELRHPLFGLNPNILETDQTFNVYPPIVTATTGLSGKELAYSLNFPQKSVAGLPVFECAEFGRNIVTYAEEDETDSPIRLGQIFHMNHVEKLPASISKDSLASHTFITGSTGTGKSNTIYKMLDEARKQGVTFMVIEPAKGEYKHVFGNDADVQVYGTNPYVSDLLQINPFSFPEGVHVLEHLDRLIEIFNVCWPMYAAMPAVLKNAIEKAYEDSGWNLVTSTNPYGPDLYPNFDDVIRNIKEIIDSSEYDNENKGAYKGSLLTRLQSLTNGINGLIFTDKEIDACNLFNHNVIVDLSRVGSSETKSLLMGLLVLKLQEYRMTESVELNSKLRHLTVLEEAHNILKRTSIEQSMEGSNLVGKSVEMISNAIAEMRTYGEGFIIADQAPGLLDMSAIRNTNTKLILRLPEQSDRELVGRAANLNDDQILELAKLPRGVAALYQNEWIQPILCNIDRFDTSNKKFLYKRQNLMDETQENRLIIAELLSLSSDPDQKLEPMELRSFLDRLHLDGLTKVRVLDFISTAKNEFSMHKLSKIMVKLYPELLTVIKEQTVKIGDNLVLTNILQEKIDELIPSVLTEQTRRDIIQAVMTYYYIFELNDDMAFQDWAKNGGLI